MSEAIGNNMLTPEEAVKNEAHCICFAMDDDMIKGLQRIKDILGFQIGFLVSEALRPFINTFLPIADLHEQGKLTADCIPEFMRGLESLDIRKDVAKARLDKKVKKLERQQK